VDDEALSPSSIILLHIIFLLDKISNLMQRSSLMQSYCALD
jgi:hypothetical protein